MTRTRLALLLGAAATVAVLATAVLAATTYVRAPETSGSLVLTDPGSGATLEVPGGRWRVRAPTERISYGGARVAGPALYDEGSCAARPEGSFRALAGFTAQPFGTWLRGLAVGRPDPTVRAGRERVGLTGGERAAFRWARLPAGSGPCAAAGVELAMVRAGGVRAVVVADTGADGDLTHADVRALALGLELP